MTMEDNNNIQEQNDNKNRIPGGFLGVLLYIACSIAFIPAIDIPWNKTIWIDDWHYYEESSGFFLRALKVILIAISVITLLVTLYVKYKDMENNDGQDK